MENEDVNSILNDIFYSLDCDQDFELIDIYQGKRQRGIFEFRSALFDDLMHPNRGLYSFGFWDEGTPYLIEKLGIGQILCKDWYVFTFDKSRDDQTIDVFCTVNSFNTTNELINNGVLKKEQVILSSLDVDWNKNLPKYRFTLKIYISKLKRWVENNKNFKKGSPIFNAATGTLLYGGESVKFKINSKESRSIDLLIKNFGSLVSKKAFCEVCGDKYPTEIGSTRVTKIHEALEDRFKSIKQAIRKNSKLRNRLIFSQQNGFGVFENKNPSLIEE